MKKEEIISMTPKEWKRFGIIQEVLKKKIRQTRAAALLALSLRQIQRLIQRVRSEGPKGIPHKLRGRVSNRKFPQAFKTKVLGIYKTHYLGFGPTLAQEKLWERERIRIGRESLRLWLLEKGLYQRTKKSHPYRTWRERKASFGEMVQMDGSHHDWLEGRGPKLVLMGSIDDATGHTFARFYDYEGTLPAMDSFLRYTSRYGLPLSVYLDKHTTYRGFGKVTPEEELEGKTRTPSQFERALGELGVQVIHAHSPQAKGRVERLFGIFQDRLIKEMRLRGIKTKEEANRFLQRFLPGYNRRFQKEPRSAVNLHRPIPSGIDLKRIFCVKTRHLLRKDSTFSHGGRLYLARGLEPKKGKRSVSVEERPDGRVLFFEGNALLQVQILKEAPKAFSKPKPSPSFRLPRGAGKPHPSPDHPWRFKTQTRLNQIQSLLKLKNMPKEPIDHELATYPEDATLLTGTKYDISKWR